MTYEGLGFRLFRLRRSSRIHNRLDRGPKYDAPRGRRRARATAARATRRRVARGRDIERRDGTRPGATGRPASA